MSLEKAGSSEVVTSISLFLAIVEATYHIGSLQVVYGWNTVQIDHVLDEIFL